MSAAQATYGLKEGIDAALSMIRRKMGEKEGRPVIVEIAGGTGSGKTSEVAQKIIGALGSDATALNMDNYYKGLDDRSIENISKGIYVNVDTPDTTDIGLLARQLSEISEGRSVEMPVFSFKTQKREGYQKFVPGKVVVVEGIFGLNEAIAKYGDVRIFVSAGTHGRLVRRLIRDMKRTVWAPGFILGYFSEIAEPMHQKHVESTRKYADIVISNEFDAKSETPRLETREVQLKFRHSITRQELERIGARLVSEATEHTDRYYSPDEPDLAKTGEIFRVSESGDRLSVTYKGPLQASGMRRRPVYEFQIERKVEGSATKLYCNLVKVVKKRRTGYVIDGVNIYVDDVAKVVGGREQEIGSFVELSYHDEKGIESVMVKMGLDAGKGIRSSYFEM
ncbi:MAG: CYTH domain-containing protein [Candidatus Micrarchaeota archaeon]|nr:CYTH domain-containing protein [Candidatus Micrarchaeota archaeon]